MTKETPASFEPAVDYVVTKIPRWPFDKFVKANKSLTTSMKSTGEVMAIGRSYEESLLKAIRSLDIDKELGYSGKYADWTDEELRGLLAEPTDERIFAIYVALKRGMKAEEISEITGIQPYFLYRMENILAMENEIKAALNPEVLRKAKRTGFTDEQIGRLTGQSREEITDMRISAGDHSHLQDGGHLRRRVCGQDALLLFDIRYAVRAGPLQPQEGSDSGLGAHTDRPGN